MREAPAADDALTVLSPQTLTVAGGREAGEQIIGLPAGRRPTAAFCANDLLALGLLQEMVRHGVRVPDDLAIVGYDDIDFAAAAAVPLTSVRKPRYELGRRAAELLLDEAPQPRPPARAAAVRAPARRPGVEHGPPHRGGRRR